MSAKRLTVNEAAEWLRASPRTLIRWLADAPVIDKDALDTWIKSREYRPK